MELCFEGKDFQLALIFSIVPSFKESCSQGNQIVLVKTHKSVLNHNVMNSLSIPKTGKEDRITMNDLD